jgi:predicted dehydrogenase
MSHPVTVAIVGAGQRSQEYARFALQHPDLMQVVAVAEPHPTRRAHVAQQYGIPPERQFASYTDLIRQPRLAEAAINGTMDHLHHPSSLPLLDLGYHLLLEKPIAATEPEVRDLIAAAQRNRVTVMICHVLRYAPLYARIKELLVQGAIGDLVAFHSSENVSFHHYAAAFIRGKWNRRDTSNPMLLAKCCHDLDLLTWMFSGQQPARVASFGSQKVFRPENAPAGSAARCLNGCSIEATCPYSARAQYLEQDTWPMYAWEGLEHLGQPTREQKEESLRTDNPLGRCVWHCDNDVVDHQTVIVEFENGTTASHNMLCATARGTRTMHLVGTLGELEGDLHSGLLKLRRFNHQNAWTALEEVIQLDVVGQMHGGGDQRLVEDFVQVVRGRSTSLGATHIQDSLTGHLIAFAADRAMLDRRVVEFSAP